VCPITNVCPERVATTFAYGQAGPWGGFGVELETPVVVVVAVAVVVVVVDVDAGRLVVDRFVAPLAPHPATRTASATRVMGRRESHRPAPTGPAPQIRAFGGDRQ
jgi:hypothetical protein